MIIERVTFERVFDVVQSRGDFSFDSGGRAVYGVNLCCGIVPRPGATFVVAFREPGNWHSVLGWRDLDADVVTLKVPALAAFLFLVDEFWLIVALLLVGAAQVLLGPLGAMAVVALMAGLCVAALWRVARQRRALRRMLREAC